MWWVERLFYVRRILWSYSSSSASSVGPAEPGPDEPGPVDLQLQQSPQLQVVPGWGLGLANDEPGREGPHLH